jgi:hypothetical protein
VAVTDKRSLKQKLALASCSLLSQQSAFGAAVENDWVFDSSFVSYSEGDDRVSVKKAVIDVSGKIAESDKIALMVVFDTMTGSTPTGGVQTSTITSVTGASGAGGFNAMGSPTALAPFSDTRLAVNADWEREISSTFRITNGAAISVENDYTSLGYSFNFAKDSVDKLTTYAGGISYAHDTISQIGGTTPGPMTNVNLQTFYGEGERNTLDMLFGITRVLNARTIWQNNLWFGFSRGYHTDPYKVISAANENDVEGARYFESRPDSRNRSVWYSKLVRRVGDINTFHLSYRYYADDWDIKSHTLDLKWRFNLHRGQYIKMHTRTYTQTQAEFFYRSLPFPVLDTLPEYASADSRLDEMIGFTHGISFGKDLGNNAEVRTRLEFIQWKAENAVIDETDALLIQISFKKGFF